MRVIHAENYYDMSRKAANILSAQVILKPDCVLGLATGSTPVGAYRQLVEWYRKGDLDFSEVTTVNLDEYLGIAPDHPQSYRYFMKKNLLDEINIKPTNANIPNSNSANPEAECMRYDELIRSLGGIDLQLLGIGRNGHIGFNEPGASFAKMTHVVDLKDSTRKANSRFFETKEQVPKQAVTMGIRLIMQAKMILLVAAGPEKMKILHQALYGPVMPEVPASILQMHGDVTVVYSENAQ